MHELGHNIGLHHGGADDINQKPNYLSIMNYAFSFSGLIGTRHAYDYSRFGPDSDPANLMPVLDEAHLDEATGLGTSSQPVGTNALGYWSLRYCPGDPNERVIKQLNQPIDWDCNHLGGRDDILTDIAVAGVNGDVGELLKFHPYNDWTNLIFTGNGIGSLGNASLPFPTQDIAEATPEELQSFADFWAAQTQGQDSVPPTTTGTPSPQPNAAGWNNTDVTVTLTATDNVGGSGVKQISYGASGAQSIATTVTNGASAVITLTAEGMTTIIYFATDIAGNTEAAHVLTIHIDKTPQTISETSNAPPNVYGGNNNSVTVSVACSDGLSGLAPGSPPAATVVSTEAAGQSVTGTCTDIAGNSASATVANINIDRTPPSAYATASPGPNASGWNNTNVTVRFSGADNLSGIDFCAATVSLTSEGAGQTATGTCTDKAGNVSVPATAKVNIDKTPPVISGMPSASCSLWPPNGELVQIATVTASDALSGLAPGSFNVTGTSSEPAGDPQSPDIVISPNGTGGFVVQLRGDRLGNGSGRIYGLTAAANDLAGNATTVTASCTVPHDQGKK
jgi:hypothetical protein